MTNGTTPPDRSGDENRVPTYRVEKFDAKNPIHSGALRQNERTGEYINENVRRAPEGHIAFPASRFAGGKTLEEHGLETQGTDTGARRDLRRKTDPEAAKAVESAIAALIEKQRAKNVTSPSKPEGSAEPVQSHEDRLRAIEARKKAEIARRNAAIAKSKQQGK